MSKIYGLIGYPLEHSHSPAIYEKLFVQNNLNGAKYELFPLPAIEDLPELINAQPNLAGFNVTIPHKHTIVNHITKLSPLAQDVGAVNAIKVFRKGTHFELIGYNTDIYGFVSTLEKHQLKNTQALVFGNGGAAQAVKYALSEKNIDYQIVSRKSQGIRYSDLTPEILNKYPILINTTPVGMHPKVDEKLSIPEDGITSDHTLIDLIYNPEETSFMKMGIKKGAAVINGRVMLEKQAERALEIWME